MTQMGIRQRHIRQPGVAEPMVYASMEPYDARRCLQVKWQSSSRGNPVKHYATGFSKGSEIPFVPPEEDGTVHDKLPDPDYLSLWILHMRRWKR